MKQHKEYHPLSLLTGEKLEEIFFKLNKIKIAVIGDCCLDIYWEADMTRSVLSRETPHFPLPVTEERISLGAGANVASNLVALGIKKVFMLGVIGKDWRGREFKKIAREQGIDLQGLIERKNRFTSAYCKPIRHGYSEKVYEDSRIDFENTSPVEENTERKLLQHLDSILPETDTLIINDQLDKCTITEKIIKRLSDIASEKLVIADSRKRIDHFKNIIIKPNEIEAFNAVDLKTNSENSFEDWIKAGKKLTESTGAPVLLTLGSRGALWVEADGWIVHVPAIPVEKPYDIVGAGDCFGAAFSSALTTGVRPEEAIAFAHLASSISLKKLRITGTASRDEILDKYNKWRNSSV